MAGDASQPESAGLRLTGPGGGLGDTRLLRSGAFAWAYDVVRNWVIMDEA
jgi:hypothetical protein